MSRLRAWAAALHRDVIALWFARDHPATPVLARWVALLVVAYALSPIDLIPDFVPVLGLLDDLLLVPAGIWLAIRLVPAPVLGACRVRAAEWIALRRARPRSGFGAAPVLAVWLAVAAIALGWLLHRGS